VSERQQVLYLWLAEGALDQPVVAWAFHDGAAGGGPGLPEGDPPYPTGLAALEDGWFLLQSPAAQPVSTDTGQETGPLTHEFVFERRVAKTPDS
jgi:hypothetical protein